MLTLGHDKCIPSEGLRVLFHVTGKTQRYLIRLISLQHVHMLRTVLFWRSYLRETNGDHLTRGQHVFWLRWICLCFSPRSRNVLIWDYQHKTEHKWGDQGMYYNNSLQVTVTPRNVTSYLFSQQHSCHHKYRAPHCLSPLLYSLSQSQSQVAISLIRHCPYLTMSCDLDVGQVQCEYVSVSSKSTPA